MTRCDCGGRYRLVAEIHSAEVAAGILRWLALQDAPLALWQTTMDTNVRGPWLLTRAVFDLLLSSDAVRVLLMSSGAGWGYRVGTGLYNISKAALNSLCHSLAHEFAERYPRRDVQINGILPGIARTEMNPDATESPFSAVSIVLLLLTHPPGGPNGRFFHRDGRHIEFGASLPYPVALQGGTGEQCGASGGTG